MISEEAAGRVEILDAVKPGSDRKSRGGGAGASRVTAKRGYSHPEMLQLMEAVVERENMKTAWLRGKGNKGAAGVDGMLRGWVNYFRLPEVKGVLEDLDGWLRRRFRCILWRQWKRSYTRARNLMKRGLSEERAWHSATNGRGPWWNAGASHMNEAFPKRFFDELGLVSLLDHLRLIQSTS